MYDVGLAFGNASDSKKLNTNLLEEIDEIITRACKLNELPSCDENANSDSKLKDIEDVNECLGGRSDYPQITSTYR